MSPRFFPSSAEAYGVLGPVDAKAGGIWLGVNELGVIGCILNYYPHHQEESPGQRSRGNMLLDRLQRAASARDVLEGAGGKETLAVCRGFIVFAMDHEASPLAASWDGREYRELLLDPVTGFLTTSSWNPDHCRKVREACFASAGPDPLALDRAHTRFDPTEAEASPLMTRADAATDSITVVSLLAGEARMTYREVRGQPPVPGPEFVERLGLISGASGA